MLARPQVFGPATLARALVFGSERRLAVYGSLRPGEQHHDLVDDLTAVAAGHVCGTLRQHDGYPILTVRAGFERVAVVVLEGVELASRWPRLDDFEGAAYRRELVLVELDEGGVLVANCYVDAADD